ncbi:unnamed protein product [Coccothraustes coccothraustes]
MAQQNAAKKRPPGKKREADAKSSSHLSRQPRLDENRRRSWRQRARDSVSQTGKPIRLNRVPLLHAETSIPGTATQEVPRLSQAVVLVSSSSSSSSRRCPSFPGRKRALKRGRPQRDVERRTPESPPAKRRRMDDVPAWNTESSSSSQVASRLFQESQTPTSQAVLYIPPWVLPRSQPGPIRTKHIWRQQRREKTPYSRPENQGKTR